MSETPYLEYKPGGFIFYGIWNAKSIKHKEAPEHAGKFKIHLNHKPAIEAIKGCFRRL